MKNLVLMAFVLMLGTYGLSWADEHPKEHPTGAAKQEHPTAKPGEPAAAAQVEGMMAEGEVLDMSCYMDSGASGSSHAKCAKQCLLDGSGAGLLKADGSVVLLIQKHGKEKAYKSLAKMAGQQAKVSGKPVSRGGVSALLVDKVEKAK